MENNNNIGLWAKINRATTRFRPFLPRYFLNATSEQPRSQDANKIISHQVS